MEIGTPNIGRAVAIPRSHERNFPLKLSRSTYLMQVGWKGMGNERSENSPDVSVMQSDNFANSHKITLLWGSAACHEPGAIDGKTPRKNIPTEPICLKD